MDEPLTLARFLLVRHGESQVMVDGVIGGMRTCSGLSDLGRQQAKALHDRFASGTEPDIDVIYASPMPRARETTDIVAPGIGSLAINTHDDLEEFRFGDADGLTWAQARERYGGLSIWQEDPHRPVVPGADSRAGFRHRVAMALSDIATAHPGATVFVGCHGGVVSAALALAFGVGVGQPTADLPTAVTSITELECQRWPDREPRWRLHRYNDATHLESAGLARSSQSAPS